MKKSLLTAFIILFATQAQASVDELIENIKQNNVPAIVKLLNQGEDVNAVNEQGNTPLHYAIVMDNAEITKLLLEKGADLNASNNKGWTPAKIAEKKQVPNVMPIIRDALKHQTAKAAQIADTTQTGTNVLSEQEKAKYKEVIMRAKEGILTARKERDKTMEYNKRLESEIAKLKADNALLEKRLNNTSKTTSDAVETTNTFNQASKEKVNQVSNVATTAATAQKQKKSAIISQIYQGDEEIVYCLNYFGQGDDKNMLKAAGYYASAAGISKVRYNQIADIANKFFASADSTALQKRNEECGKIITPSNADKQNKIIRSLNLVINQ